MATKNYIKLSANLKEKSDVPFEALYKKDTSTEKIDDYEKIGKILANYFPVYTLQGNNTLKDDIIKTITQLSYESFRENDDVSFAEYTFKYVNSAHNYESVSDFISGLTGTEYSNGEAISVCKALYRGTPIKKATANAVLPVYSLRSKEKILGYAYIRGIPIPMTCKNILNDLWFVYFPESLLGAKDVIDSIDSIKIFKESDPATNLNESGKLGMSDDDKFYRLAVPEAKYNTLDKASNVNLIYCNEDTPEINPTK